MSEVVRRVFTEISEHHTYVMLYQLYPVHPPPHITYHILFKFPPPASPTEIHQNLTREKLKLFCFRVCEARRKRTRKRAVLS